MRVESSDDWATKLPLVGVRVCCGLKASHVTLLLFERHYGSVRCSDACLNRLGSEPIGRSSLPLGGPRGRPGIRHGRDPRRPPDTPTDPLADGLGPCSVKTVRTMPPIRKKGGADYLTRMYDIRGGRPTAARELGDLLPSQDLGATPDLALVPDIAAIMFVGMREGWLIGKRLSDYFDLGRADRTAARCIISGQDQAAEIGMHARTFRFRFD